MNRLCARGHRALGIDQLLEPVDQISRSREPHRRDLDNPIGLGRQSGGLQVERDVFEARVDGFHG